MNLRYIITLYATPMIILSVALMGFFQHTQIKSAALETYRIYMEAIVRSYIDQELENRFKILQDAGLSDNIPFVKRYLTEAVSASVKVAERESAALYILRNNENISADIAGSEWFSTIVNDHRYQPEQGFITIERENIEGINEQYMTFWMTYEAWNMKVFMVKKDTDLQNTIHDHDKSFIFVSISILLLTLGYLIIVFNHLAIKPVLKLANSASQLSKRDFASPIEESGKGEIADLCKAMEKMRLDVKDYNDMLSEWNERLKAEVDEATLDIREKQAELNRRAEKLEQSNKELEQFAYVASHDLQEPLRMVSGFLTLISKKYKGNLDATADEYIAFAVDGADRLKTMITDLLAFSRVATQGKPFEITSLSDCVQIALDNLELKIQENHALVNVGELPEILGDKTQMVQLFQNLIDNSIKYKGNEDPVIDITASDMGDGLTEISVCDNGIGIPDEYHEKAFLVFHRLHGDASISGSGIGLAVCRKVLQRHGSDIDIRANAPNGTCFFFRFRT